MRVAPLTILYGSSGVGKSSILRAGVAHEIQASARDLSAENGKPDVIVVVFNAWKDDPHDLLIEQIDEAISALVPSPLPSTSKMSLSDHVQQRADELQCEFLLILDQFEEYMLYHPSTREITRFETELIRLINRRTLPVNVLISLRDDALHQLDRLQGEIPALWDNLLRIEPLTLEGGRDAIQKPIDAYNEANKNFPDRQYVLESALVDRVLAELTDTVPPTGIGGLGKPPPALSETKTQPLIETAFLQMVMTRIWNVESGRNSRCLALSTLTRLGGAKQIIASHVDTQMAAISPQQRPIAADLFQYLVTPSGKKVAYSLDDLAHQIKRPVREVEAVLDGLSQENARILRTVANTVVNAVPNAADPPPIKRYEIFHDLLAPYLLDWRRRIVRKRELETQRLHFAVIVVALVIVAGIILGLQRAILTRQTQIESALRLERSSEVAAERGDRDLALALALQANDIDRSLPSTELQVANVAYQPGTQRLYTTTISNQVYTLDLSPDGQRVLVGYDNGIIAVWDVFEQAAEPYTVTSGDEIAIILAAFVGDGSRALTLTMLGAMQIWDTTTWEMLAATQIDSGNIVAGALSPDDRFLAVSNWDGEAHLYTLTMDGALSAQASVPPYDETWGLVNTVSFSANSNYLLLATEGIRPEGTDEEDFFTAETEGGAVVVWDIAAGAEIERMALPQWGSVISAVFTPDGEQVVFGVNGGTDCPTDLQTNLAINPSPQCPVYAWSWHSDEPLTRIGVLSLPISALAVSPDGNIAATASLDSAINLWTLGTGDNYVPYRTFTGDALAAYALQFAPDGGSLVSGAGQTTRQWRIDWGGIVQRYSSLPIDSLNAMVVHPDGRSVFVTSEVGITQFEVESGTILSQYQDRGADKLALNADATQIVFSSYDENGFSVLFVWSPNINTVTQLLWGETDNTALLNIFATAYSSDGRTIYALTTETTETFELTSARLWRWDSMTYQLIDERTLTDDVINSLAINAEANLALGCISDYWQVKPPFSRGCQIQHSSWRSG